MKDGWIDGGGIIYCMHVQGREFVVRWMSERLFGPFFLEGREGRKGACIEWNIVFEPLF